AASAIIAGSVPAICTEMGAVSPSWLARREVLSVCQRSLRDVTISLTAYPAPSRLHSIRNGRSVTPAMGATHRAFGSSIAPMCMGWDPGEGRVAHLLASRAAPAEVLKN